MSSVEHVAEVGNVVGESPVWHVDEQALYWVDAEDSIVFRLDPESGELQAFDVDIPITALTLRAAGGWVAASKVGLYVLDESFTNQGLLVDPVGSNPELRLNDAVADRNGRIWTGSVNDPDFMAPDGGLYRVDAADAAIEVDGGFANANGICTSPDGRRLYVSDMFHRQVRVYDLDPVDGTLGAPSIFLDVPEGHGFPDGLTSDEDGFIWVGFWDGGRVGRYSPTGELEREIEFPVANVTRCTFGGAGLNDLYTTTAAYGLTEAEMQEQPHAGDLFRVSIDVRGIPEAQVGII